jgi:hypothetical protein
LELIDPSIDMTHLAINFLMSIRITMSVIIALSCTDVPDLLPHVLILLILLRIEILEQRQNLKNIFQLILHF